MTLDDNSARTAVLDRRSRDALLPCLVAGLLMAALLGGYLGWRLNDDVAARSQITISRTFSGTVTVVDGPGDAACVQPADGGSPVCSIVAVPDGGSIQTGDQVHAAHEIVHQGNGNSYDLLMIYSLTTPAGS